MNHANDRFTIEDVPLGGVVIPLDLGRDTSGHVAFGYGIHYCLGAPLARMEAEVALGALLAQFPEISLAVSPEDLRWRPVSLMNGLDSLPVRIARHPPS